MKVVHPKQLPTKSPIAVLAVIWLLLDRAQVNQMGMGAFYAFSFIAIAGWIFQMSKENKTYIFEE